MAGWFDRVRAAVAALRGSGVQEAPGAGGGGGAAKRDPTQVVVKRLGLAADVAREAQGPTDFNLEDITNAYERESLVRQAIDRYVELLFKSGWDLVGKNQAAIDYVRLRLRYMAEVTGIPTEQLFLELAEDLVLYSNAVVLKSRAQDPSSLPPGVTVTGLGGQQPIAGYFPVDVTTMKNIRDKNGVVKRWEQEVPGQDKPVKFNATEVVHFYYKRRKGKAWGTPFLIPVLDDLRALRQAEENVLRLLYRNLFPFYHYQVGLNEDGLYGTNEEVQETQNKIENLDLEAGIVTTERHKINPIASNHIIDANPYLKYFWERCVMGLGVPETLLGKSSTSNKATADQLSVEMRDRIKAIQKVLATFIDHSMISEILLEGGFDPVLNPDDDVDFVFREIDTDGMIKQQNHAIFQYEHNAITFSEMRTMLGRDPLTDTAEMFMNVVTVPVAIATAAAKSAVSAAAQPGTPATNNKNQPTNQHGTKPSPKKKASDDESIRLAEDLQVAYDRMTDDVTGLIDSVYEDPTKRETAGKMLAAILAESGAVMRASLHEHVDEDPAALMMIGRLLKQVNDSTVELMNEVSQSKAWAIDSFQTTAMVLNDRIEMIISHLYPAAVDTHSPVLTFGRQGGD